MAYTDNVGVGTAITDSNGNEVIKVVATASAVNELTVTNAATGTGAVLSATGGDTNISLNLVPKGSGTVQANGTKVAVVSDLPTLATATSASLANGASLTVTHAADTSYARRVAAYCDVTSGGAVLLLNCNGSNNSTTFTDSSSAARTVTANGNAKLTTGTVKYGSAAATFDGSGDYLSFTGTISDFAFPADYTVEFWLRLNTVSGSQTLIDFRAGGGGAAAPDLLMSGATLQLYVNGGFQITSSSLSTGVWYHVALCRSGSSTKLFIDGVQSGSTYTNSTSLTCGTNGPWIGYDGASYHLNGYLDDIRFTRSALYTGTFTPPGSELTAGGTTYKKGLACPSDSGLTMRYDDGAGADPTTKTTFTNATGGTLTNVVVQVFTGTLAP